MKLSKEKYNRKREEELLIVGIFTLSACVNGNAGAAKIFGPSPNRVGKNIEFFSSDFLQCAG